MKELEMKGHLGAGVRPGLASAQCGLLAAALGRGDRSNASRVLLRLPWGDGAGPQCPLECCYRKTIWDPRRKADHCEVFCQKFCCEKVNLEFSEEKQFSPGGTLMQRLFRAGFLYLIVFLSMKVDFMYLVQFRAVSRNCQSAFLICRL